MSVSRTDWRTPSQLDRERALAPRLRRGDREAWGELYDTLAPELYRRILMPRLANPTAAEDALSETFRAALERIERFEDTGHGIYPWLARIAANKAMDLHRVKATTRRKLSELTRSLDALTAPVAGAEELLELKLQTGDLRSLTVRVLERLNPRYRTAIELRFFRAETREACAQLMGLKLGTFDVVLLRALRAFRVEWAKASCSQAAGGHD